MWGGRVLRLRVAFIVVGVMFMLVGLVWFFQGINLLPGSFMTGQRQWAIYGTIIFLVGGVVLWVGRRMRRPHDEG